MTTAPAVTSLVGVYDADGSLAGEVTYVVLHLLGRAECSLCDITHGLMRRKRSFDELRAGLGLPFDLLHRDELDAELAEVASGRLPCVVAQTADGPLVLVGPDELRGCSGDVGAFGRVLRSALDSVGEH